MRLFLISQTQWRCHSAGLLGLDYNALALCASVHGLDLDADTMTRVQIIEGAILRGQAGD